MCMFESAVFPRSAGKTKTHIQSGSATRVICLTWPRHPPTPLGAPQNPKWKELFRSGSCQRRTHSRKRSCKKPKNLMRANRANPQEKHTITTRKEFGRNIHPQEPARKKQDKNFGENTGEKNDKHWRAHRRKNGRHRQVLAENILSKVPTKRKPIQLTLTS